MATKPTRLRKKPVRTPALVLGASRRHRRVLLKTLSLLLILSASCYSRGESLPGPASPPVTTAPTANISLPPGKWSPVRQGEFRLYYTTVGEFLPKRVSELGCQVSGLVKRVYVREGQWVSKGSLLLELEDTFLALAVKQALTNLSLLEAQQQSLEKALEMAKTSRALAEVDLQEAKKTLQRAKALLGESPPAISQDQYDHTFFSFQKAQLNLKGAEQKEAQVLAQLKVLAQKKALQEVTLQTAQEKLRRTKVYAPFSGLVSQLFVHPGTKVSAVPPTKLLRLEETSRLRLRFSLPQRLASHLKPQITIHFRLANSKWRKASATSLGYASPKSRTLFFEGEVPNRERTLLPNMYCEVKLVTAHYPKAFFLPKKALHPASQGGTQIWIKRRGKVFSFQPEILGYQREYVVLEKGLEPDDQVYVLK